MSITASTSRKIAIRPDTYLLTHVLGIPLLLALLAGAIHRWGLDMAVARLFYDAHTASFPWRNSLPLELLGHRLVLILPVGVAVSAVVAAIASHWFPVLRPWRGTLWAITLTCSLGPLIILQLKHHTALPRPYNLSVFGGYADFPLHFWADSRREAGGALPSNHAGAGYAMLSLYFAGWAMDRPAWRWGGLAIGIGAGLLFSAVRVMQGAHFLSQTVWSACVMWCLASILFYRLIVRPRAAVIDTRCNR